MTRCTLSGAAALGFSLVLGAAAWADDAPTVSEDPAANGWTVRVSFGRDPKAFARAVHTWTLPRAKVAAKQLGHEFSDKEGGASIASLRIEGKDGDGEITPEKGPHPYLSDWPLVEQKFRASNKAQLKTSTKDSIVREAYQKAQQKTEELVKPRQPIPAEAEKALQQLYKNYNDKLDELAKGLHKGPPQPVALPRLNLPEPPFLEKHVKDWDDAKKDQFLAETMSANLAKRKAELDRFEGENKTERKRIEIDRENGTNPDSLPRRERELKEAQDQYSRGVKALRDDEKALQELDKATDNRLKGLENSLADNSRIPPGADGFASKTGGAAYVGDDTPKVYKTDSEGKPLADDKQPQGYPKPYRLGDRLAADEKAIVDPSLKVKPLDRVPNDVKAGVFGRVVDVDRNAGAMTVQVDESGSKLQFMGVDPRGVQPNDFIEPSTVIGKWKSSSGEGSFRLIIRAVNPRNQFVPPGPLLNYGRRPPVGDKTLQRSVPEADPTPSDGTGKAKLPEGDGKYKPELSLTMDESVGKGGLRKWFEYDETNRKEKMLSAKEVAAKGELERQKEAAERSKDSLGLLKAKMKAADTDLETARNKLKVIDAEGSQYLKRARDVLERKKELDEERDDLKKDKAALEEKAARVKASKNNKEIDAFNEKVKRHNEKDDKLQEKYKKWTGQQKDLRDEIASAERDRTKAEQEESRLKKEKDQIQSKMRTAEAQSMTAQNAMQKKQDALKAIADERQKLQEKLKELGPMKEPNPKE